MVAAGVKPTPFSSGVGEAVEDEAAIAERGTTVLVVLAEEDELRASDRRRSESERWWDSADVS